MVKRLFNIVAICLTAMLFVGCAKAKYQESAERLNSKCPVEFSESCQLTKVEFKEDVFIYTFIYDQDLDIINENIDLYKKAFCNLVKVKNKLIDADDTDTFIELTISKHFVIRQKSSGEECVIKVSHDNNDLDLTDDDLMELYILKVNSKCPFEVEEGLVTEKWFVEDNAVVLLYKVDEEIHKLSDFEENKDQIISTIIDPENFDAGLKVFVQNGKDIIFRYEGIKTGETVDIVAENSLLPKEAESEEQQNQ